MVDLDCVESSKPPPPLEVDSILPETPPNQPKQLCRLCLHDEDMSEKVFDIFEDAQDDKGNKIKGLEDVLYELFQIKYDRSCSNLPHVICHRCWELVQAFNSFRQIVQQTEERLQKRLELMKSNAFLQDLEDKRPGLNGNPGIFVPDDDCEIEEVNPDQEFESSEDDFSMESDSEPEDIKVPLKEKESFVAKAPQPAFVKNPTMPKTPIMNDMPQSKDVSAILSEHKGLEFTITTTYLCQYCDMAFTTQPECLDHESTHDSQMPYVCNFCPKHYNNRQTMISHIKELHDPEKPYICALCRKGFCRRSDLKKHTIVHTGVRPFSCPLCTKSFSRNTNLYKHMRIHSSIKPYVCQQCPRSFSTGTDLLRHARTHSEIKNFKCSKCPSTYARKDKLQIHEQSHHRKEAEMLMNQARGVGGFPPMPPEEHFENMAVPLNPYITQELNQIKSLDEQQRLMFSNVNFPQRPAVFPQLAAGGHSVMTPPPPPPKNPPTTKSSHPRLHTCDICAKSFTRERDFQRHQALHLDTLFTCKQCGLGFSRREKLARHELEHHAPQYPCDICRITFHKKDELDIHLKMHELQQNAALSAHQAVLNAAGVVHPAMELSQIHHVSQQPLAVVPSQALPAVALPPPQRPSAADMSFYSQMVPTMNLGFYSETRPEDRNGI